jgi:hypothetical protein
MVRGLILSIHAEGVAHMMVYPVEGRAVRDPRNFQLLPAEGREVPDGDSFWLRRLRDGDVTNEAPAAPDEARRVGRE